MIVPDVVRNLVSELGTLLGLPGAVLDDEGYCGLLFDGRTQVGLQYHQLSRELVVFSTLGTVGSEVREEAYRTMLRANRFWVGTGGATLSLEDGDPPVAVLARSLTCEGKNAAGLADDIARFVATADDWAEYLSGTETATTMADGTPAPGLRA